jgi:hypothetical protein
VKLIQLDMKKSEQVSLWVQLATGVAVIIGLVLVVWELQQSREIAKLQIVSQGWSEDMANIRARIGESFAETQAKACFEPNQLTKAEIFEMTAYFNLIVAMARRKKEFVSLGETATFSWEELARLNVAGWLSYEVGREDFKSRTDIDPQIKEIGEAILHEKSFKSCAENWAPYVDAVRDLK